MVAGDGATTDGAETFGVGVVGVEAVLDEFHAVCVGEEVEIGAKDAGEVEIEPSLDEAEVGWRGGAEGADGLEGEVEEVGGIDLVGEFVDVL